MSATPEPPSAQRRHRLTTFGTLSLTAPGGAVVDSRAPQRRRLALLAVLAAAGERGRSRDELLLLFWPDATQERARHSLEQLMYAIRGSITKDVFVGVNPVRLNPDAVSSDVADFRRAIAADDPEAAVALYAGPFLDGFYLSDAPEFEQWVAAERGQLQRSYTDALQRLATRAEAAGDDGAAVRWWRALTEADPVSGTFAAGLIRALMNAGDHAAALQHAERYEAVVARELGTGVGPAVADLVAEARATASRAATGAPKPHLPAPAPAPVLPPASGNVVERVPTPRDSRVRAPRFWRRVPVAVIAAGAVAAAGVIAMRAFMHEDRSRPAEQVSVAILPFVNVSGDAADEQLADGLSEELIAVLSRIPNLRVIARTSAFAFKGSDAGARAIADSLGVSNILEGSVQRDGPRLRVRVRLVDAADGSTRWSETYDRAFRDVFAVQDDIARAVAAELDLRLGVAASTPLRRQPTANVAAYELYLRGSDRALLRSDSAAREGLEYLQRAVALDPSYAAAWAGVARMYGVVAQHVPMSEHRRYHSLAEEAARKALVLDPALADAHAVFGVLRMRLFDFQSAERHLRRAVALDPTSALAHEWLVTLYLWTGRPADALRHARRALELDPLSPYAHAEVARALLANDRCDEALAYVDKLSGLQPPLRRAAPIAALCYARKEAWPQAISAIAPQAARGGRTATGLTGYLFARSGREHDARRSLTALLERRERDGTGAFDIALVYAGLRDFEQAALWLERAVADGSINGSPGNPTHAAIMGPVFGDLRQHPAFDRLRERFRVQKR